jgi:REP element-mobilizing transposase RayT
MIEGVKSHVVFTIKNSRYDWQKIKRKKPVGLIAPTFPFFENEEEEFLIKILCDIATELGLQIAAFNFCGDHVHAVLIIDKSDISKIMGLWKGKSAYIYNHRIQTFNENSQSKNLKIDIQNLWAKSYYQKIITSATELENVIYYVNNNRKKHGLAPLTSFSTKIISTLVNSKKE